MRNRRPDSPDSLREKLRCENTEALLNRLEDLVMKEGDTDDSELICAILDVLDEKAPIQTPYDPEEGLAKLHSRFAPAMEAVSRPQRRPRMAHALRVALAACLCLAALMMAANATGLIQWFMDWREETYALRKTSPSGQMVLTDAPEGEFTSLAEAVAYYGIQDPVVPKWIPEEYVAQRVRVQEFGDVVYFGALFLGDSQELTISVDWYRANALDGHFEHSDSTETIYSLNDIDFVLSHNEGQYHAAWMTDTCICGINGSTSEKEIRQIIKSIFD